MILTRRLFSLDITKIFPFPKNSCVKLHWQSRNIVHYEISEHLLPVKY